MISKIEDLSSKTKMYRIADSRDIIYILENKSSLSMTQIDKLSYVRNFEENKQV